MNVQSLFLREEKIDRSDDQEFAEKISDRRSQELIIAFVGPVGSGVSTCAEKTSEILKSNYGYDVCLHQRLSDLITQEASRVEEKAPSKYGDKNLYITEMQNIGNKLREKFGESYLVEKTIEKIRDIRDKKEGITPNDNSNNVIIPRRRAYILDSIKHISELKLLREVYGETVILMGIFAPDELRRERLTKNGVIKDQIDSILSRDEQEQKTFGQKTRKVFIESDFFLCNDRKEDEISVKLTRYFDLIFSSKIHTPTRTETAMYEACAAAVNSACMSRQVGASIVSEDGELIGIGWNDVPKFGGGLYREDDQKQYSDKINDFLNKDNRCFLWDKKICHNEVRRNGIIDDIINRLESSSVLKRGKKQEVIDALKGTAVDSLIEFSRSIHAEMEAIISVAREGRNSLVGATLYTNTYPCHNCARHIVASGIREVLYIEPYKKSLATTLHCDSITENPSDSEISSKVLFRQYDGVAPHNYFKVFKMSRERKNRGNMISHDPRTVTPLFSIPLDDLMKYEDIVVSELSVKEGSPLSADKE
ncbi:deaminase [Gluconobacter kondonii]|uniref:anti-phage dCTP deaminase n=1 Tax=Gluconobacter kondonii TaxID=941463 RepID=UPI0020A1B268|nr:anti-phage dCTP deaminase [Gluconobacter kondonii]MCP1237757.1 deaminase [Gluconobacter kondonii]